MALVLADRVEQVTRTTGLADLELAETIRGRQSFQAVTNNGDTVYYVLEDADGSAWEIGLGTVVHGTETMLQRTTIRQSTDSDNKISLSAGTHRVFLVADAGWLNERISRADTATTALAGTVEKATTAEAEAGTADKFPDAAGVRSHGDLRYAQLSGGANANFTSPPQSSGAEIYARNSILGTVSQSGGVPTGAIIERGSNANGEYVKFADGTLLVHTIRTYDTNAAARVTGQSYPVNFAVDPSGVAVGRGTDTTYAGNNALGAALRSQATSFDIGFFGDTGVRDFSIIVKGRWV